MKKQPKSNVDNYFGLLVDDDEYVMGNIVVELSGNDIVVDDTRYKGTPGLWSLITFSVPQNYTDVDMEEHKKLIKQTNAMTHPHNLKSTSRPETTWKWRNIIKEMEETGNGIEFLPSDIIRLQKELAYLLGEYRAGNTSATRSQIVAIADNLLKRKHITKAEYRKINNYIVQKSQ